MVQQERFLIQATPESGQFAALSDHAVTGPHDWHRIRAVGPSHRTGQSPVSEPFGQLAVGACFAVGDGVQQGPYAQLKGRS